MMPDEELERLVNEKLFVAFEERDIALGRDYASTVSDFSRHQALQSTSSARAVINLHTQELAIRASFALGQFKRVAASLSITFDTQLGQDTKNFLCSIIQDQSSKLTEVVKSRQPFKTSGAFGTDIVAEFATVSIRTHRDVKAEIDLWVAVLERQQRAQKGGSTQINVTGDVGIMQTGDYATASQTITLNGEGRDVISKALDMVGLALEETPEAQFNINEVKELVRECQDEIDKDQPNQTKLKASLVGIAATIQTSAALVPAYQALRGALGFIGITLP